MRWMMVLSDGETYTELAGCSIVPVPDVVPDEDIDEYVRQADGYYNFDSEPELDSNNGVTQDELALMDLTSNYAKCSGCGEMFNLNSGFERLMWGQHECNSH